MANSAARSNDNKSWIPPRLVEARADFVDGLEGLRVCDCTLYLHEADNGTIFPVHSVDLVQSAASDDGELETEGGEASIAIAYDLAESLRSALKITDYDMSQQSLLSTATWDGFWW